MRSACICPLLVGLASLLLTTGCVGRYERPPDKYSAQNDRGLMVRLSIQKAEFPDEYGQFLASLHIHNPYNDSLCIPSYYYPGEGNAIVEEMFDVWSGNTIIPYIGPTTTIVNSEPGLYYILPPDKSVIVEISEVDMKKYYSLSETSNNIRIQYHASAYLCGAFKKFETTDFLADIHPLITLVSNWATFEYSGEK